MKTATKPPKKQARAGRPKGVNRPMLPTTPVAKITLAAIDADPRPRGRVIDDAMVCYAAVHTAARLRRTDPLLIVAELETPPAPMLRVT